MPIPTFVLDLQPSSTESCPMELLIFHFYIYERDDDMSAHIKASLLGASLTIPIRGRVLDLGTWQGIYLCEFRNGGGARRITVTIVE